MSVVVLIATALPASAHAVLLHSDPSPQSTVAHAPGAVTLDFSESVEVAFGAVRVYDVDGHRADAGSITRSNGARDVTVTTPRLRAGTYTVTWRVVSADGHPVHGGFSFYVGAPSTISAVAITADRGPGRSVGWAFGVVRLLWFAALSVSVGLVVIRRWVWTPSYRRLVAAGSSDDPFRSRWPRWIVASWAALALALVADLVFEAATASGLGLLASFRPGVLNAVLHTGFGRAWAVEVAATALGAAAVTGLARPRFLSVRPTTWIVVLATAVVAMCGAEAAKGHARTSAHPLLDVVALGLHLGAVTVWFGGLAVLAVLGRRSWGRVEPAVRATLVAGVVRSFGRLAAVAAGVILITGSVEAAGDMGAVRDLWATEWGRVLSFKVALFALAIAFGARHRLVSRPRLADQTNASAEVGRFGRTAVLEACVLTATLALASALMVLIPGRSLALAASGPVDQVARIGPYSVQLLLDPSSVGTDDVHLTFSDRTGLAAGDVTSATLTIAPQAGSPASVAERLISPGHFVGQVVLGMAGRYRAVVTTGGDRSAATATFEFRIRNPR